VEDDNVIREELAQFLESPPFEISVTSCHLAASAISAVDRCPPFDAAIVDLGLPDGNGTEVIRHLRRVQPDCLPLVFTIYGDAETIFDALRVGACGYLLKQTPLDRIHAALVDAVYGGSPMSPTVARLVVSSFSTVNSPEAALSEREREILALLARGHTYADAAKALDIRLGTVQTHVKTIYAKLEISSKAEAASIAARLGLS
jgi:DNA-binding NarL/FixJ family response regulator